MFVHCDLHVCPVHSSSPACQQRCSPPPKPQSKDHPVLTVSMEEEIGYSPKRWCKDIVCGPHSTCHELYPAHCRCVDGYVSNRDERGLCSKERVLEIRRLPLDMKYVSTYANTSSLDFLQMARRVEEDFRTSMPMDWSKIKGVKVVGARQGSVLVDVALIRAEGVTRDAVFVSLVQSLVHTKNANLKIKSDKISQMVLEKQPEVKVEEEEKEDDTVLIVAIVLPIVIFVLAVVVICCICCCMVKGRRHSSSNEIQIMGNRNDKVGEDNLYDTTFDEYQPNA